MKKLLTLFTMLLIGGLLTNMVLVAQGSHTLFLPIVAVQADETSMESVTGDEEEAAFDELSAAAAWTDAAANPNASADTRQVLRWLQRPPQGCHLISAQDIQMLENASRHYSELVVGLQQATGRWVGMVGADYNSWGGDKDWRNTNRILIDYWRQGGLVQLTWTANNPWTGGDAWDTRQADLRQLLAPGTALNRQWLAELDHLAAGLEQLQQAGVVVLWRPFHELNGDWFWWGTASHLHDPRPFQALWQHMFNYFTHTKKLNNLLWVYSVAGNSPHDPSRRNVDFYYPGRTFVDIVGQDIYQASLTDLSYNELLAFGKPFALTEFGPDNEAGPLTDGSYDYLAMLDLVMRKYPETVYWLSWSDWDQVNVSIRRNRNAHALMNHQCVVTRDEIDWRAAPPPTPTPPTPTPIATPVATPTATPTPGEPDGELTIARVSKAPKIDGKIDTVWQAARLTPLTHVVLGNPVATTDLAATVRGLYDKNNLYLLVEITDDITRSSTGNGWWENDGVEIYLDGDRSAGADYDGVNDFQLGVRWNDKKLYSANGSAFLPKGKFKFVKTSQGQLLELSLPLTALGIAPNVGTRFGLDVHVNDDDGALRETKVAWHSTIDDAWLHPSSFGVGKLAE